VPLARAPPCIHDPRPGGRAGRGSHHLIDLLVIVVVLAVVVLLVSAPLRSRRMHEELESAERAELEAARDAKYREIRDAELDHRTGKLSEADWRALDRGLRAEAVDILRRLDELNPPTSGGEERS
jgi:type II secretory pathway component PulM